MKKAILASLAATLAAAGAANAGVSPYVAQKAVYGNFGVSNVEMVNSNPGDPQKAVGSDETDWAIGSRTAIGAQYSNATIMGAVRAELEFGIHAKSKVDIKDKADPASGETTNGEMSYMSYGVNVFYDLDTKTGFKPYVGAGLGLVQIDYKLHYDITGTPYSIHGEEKANQFKWNVGVGVSYALLPNLDIDLGYRYTNYGTFKETAFGDEPTSVSIGHNKFAVSADIDSHEISLGARYTF